MPFTKGWREIKVCGCCAVVGRSCVGIGGGPITCLKAQGWHRSVKGYWYCPACREEYLDSDQWSPDWPALQNEVQCAREHNEAWTCWSNQWR